MFVFFVLLSKRALAVQDNASYFSVIFGRLVVLVKRQFDIFMVSAIQSGTFIHFYCE